MTTAGDPHQRGQGTLFQRALEPSVIILSVVLRGKAETVARGQLRKALERPAEAEITLPAYLNAVPSGVACCRHKKDPESF